MKEGKSVQRLNPQSIRRRFKVKVNESKQFGFLYKYLLKLAPSLWLKHIDLVFRGTHWQREREMAMNGAGAGAAYNPRTVEEVFRDFKGRRTGLIKALTTGLFPFLYSLN